MKVALGLEGSIVQIDYDAIFYMVSRRSKLTVLCFIMSCMYYLFLGETLINFSYLILSYLIYIPDPDRCHL